jgi:hypothetical protein
MTMDRNAYRELRADQKSAEKPEKVIMGTTPFHKKVFRIRLCYLVKC